MLSNLKRFHQITIDNTFLFLFDLDFGRSNLRKSFDYGGMLFRIFEIWIYFTKRLSFEVLLKTCIGGGDQPHARPSRAPWPPWSDSGRSTTGSTRWLSGSEVSTSLRIGPKQKYYNEDCAWKSPVHLWEIKLVHTMNGSAHPPIYPPTHLMCVLGKYFKHWSHFPIKPAS